MIRLNLRTAYPACGSPLYEITGLHVLKPEVREEVLKIR